MGDQLLVGEAANSFAGHFKDKIRLNVSKTRLDPAIYNGKCKLIVMSRDFMMRSDVQECMTLLKPKN